MKIRYLALVMLMEIGSRRFAYMGLDGNGKWYDQDNELMYTPTQLGSGKPTFGSFVAIVK